MRPRFGRYAVCVAIALVVAGRCLGQGTVASGFGCASCVPPVAAPSETFWRHPLFPLFRPRTAPAYPPSMPPSTVPPSPVPPETTPKKEPEPKTPPSTETPPAEPTPTPAAGTETGPASYAFDNMFGAPFGGGGAKVILPGIAAPGALSGPGTITFSNVIIDLKKLQPSAFALIPVTVAANGLSGTVNSPAQPGFPVPTNPNAPAAYLSRNFGVPATPGQTNAFLAAVTTPLIQPTIANVPSRSPQITAQLIGQPSPVFYAAQLAQQSAQPISLLKTFDVTNGAVIPGLRSVTFTGNFATTALVPNAFATVVNIPDPAAGGVVGRYKPSEDTNPMPRDRFIFNYDYFSAVPLGVGSDVNRFNIGFEKTFFNGMTSIEVRLPFAGTVASDMVLSNQITRLEIGDLRITPRLLLYNTPTVHVGTGMSIYLPTADTVRVSANDGTPLVRIPDASVVLSPYIGILYTPDQRLFAQAWASCDFDTNGDPVYINPGGLTLAYAGRLQDPANLGLDAQVGYWVYKSPTPNSFLSGVAPFVELHYAGNLAARNVVTSGVISVPSGTINELNLTAGIYTLFGPRSALQFGAVIPLRMDDRPFGIQLGVHANFFFGPNIGPPTFVSSF